MKVIMIDATAKEQILQDNINKILDENKNKKIKIDYKMCCDENNIYFSALVLIDSY